MTDKTVMILAGEASGDLHGSHLVGEMLALRPGLGFFGMGGPALAAAGVELLVDAAKIAVVGAVEVLSHILEIRRAMMVLSTAMASRRPHLVILIDFPDFNLRMARKANNCGIPVFYYISPQVWAWRRGRVRTIGSLSRRVAVILPFEKEFYARFGVAVDYVGHPLLDSVTVSMPAADWRQRQGVEPTVPLVGLLPGSRRRELTAMLPVMIEAARKIREIMPCRFLLPLAPTVTAAELANAIPADLREELIVVRQDRYEAMAACDAVVAASGTVTLELAILGTPMVVVYRMSWLTYLLGRLLIDVPFFSLVNLIAGRRVVPELMQAEASADGICAAVLPLVQQKKENEAMRQDLAHVRQLLGGPGASRRAAMIALELV